MTPLPTVLRVADLAAAGISDRDLRRAHRRAEVVKVAPGCYVGAAEWTSLKRDERYEVIVWARLDRLAPRTVASYDSAAVLWRMPTLDEWPTDVHITDPELAKPTRAGGVVRHIGTLADDDVTIGSHLRATSPARTATDLALRDGFVSAILLFDHGLRHRLFTIVDLERSLSRRPNARRRRAVRAAVEHASPLAESPGESISRAQIILLGFEVPELQRRFFDGGREVARVDFYWSSVGVVGEFDGDEKYTNPEMTGGRSTADLLIAEKWRAERLLDLPEVGRVARWNYAAARSSTALAERLTRAGVPRIRRPGLIETARPARKRDKAEPEP